MREKGEKLQNEKREKESRRRGKKNEP